MNFSVVTLQLGGILCVYGIDGGWPSIFYLFGALGLLWTLIWCIYSADSPGKHRFINNRNLIFKLAFSDGLNDVFRFINFLNI